MSGATHKEDRLNANRFSTTGDELFAAGRVEEAMAAYRQALALSPRLILADEPTGNLDTHSANDIFELLQSVNQTQRSACLIVTHDPALASRCARQIQMVDGQLLPAVGIDRSPGNQAV